jgi:hypothetical protein
MRNLGYVYIIVGVLGFLGGLVAAYANLTIGEALTLINSEAAPPGTDISTLRASAQALSGIITMAWIWIIAVLAASAVSIYFGILSVKGRVSISRK